LKAHQAAKNWRDSKKRVIPTVQRNISISSKNNSSGTVGVSRVVKYDKRRNCNYVQYAINWITTCGVRKIKTFSLGREDVLSSQFEAHALEASKNFRRSWERHADENTLNQCVWYTILNEDYRFNRLVAPEN